MNIEEMEAKIRALEAKIQELQDIEDIKKLQRAYGFYLEHWMAEDLIDLFADGEDSELWIAAGKFRGKEAISRLFRHGNEDKFRISRSEFLHQVMQLSGVVHVNPGGKSARGRWYGFGANAFPIEGGKVSPGWMDGVYEVEYIKEERKWKLKKVHWCMTFRAPWTESFVDPAKKDSSKQDRPYQENPDLRPTDAPEDTLYPSGYICPFHFENPVSGRKTIPADE
ncbi:MAG: nuclear transport factor 2 family protein [Dehalococcoidia bacterium]|jgi:hypothetical protein